jgi:class 3 adenylate cyclase
VNCSNCGAEASPDQRFCLNCGSRLASGCPNCGNPVVEGARFCGTCGFQLVAPTAAELAPGRAPAPDPTSTPAPAAPAAERRLVSVLFADLVGFTTIAEGRDSEQVRELLTRYFDTAREVIGRYGGTVEKFIGDAVMAVWGAPVAHEDDAERAVRAALDLVESVTALDTALQLRAAVLTGEAAVTLGATNQGMVAGDLVNTASRLQSVAPAGAVLVGQATRDAASVAITFEEVGAQTLKGKELPVAAWRAVRVVGMVGGASRYTGLEPPFEGRDDDLRLLKELFNATVRERRARLVTIIGQAGTGKSRLIREFEKYIDGLAELVYWHVGRSPSYGEGISFWALGEMLRKRAGLAERDDDATTRAGIAAALEEFVPDEADRRWIEPRLLQLLGVGEARSSEREELFGAWRMFFERIGDQGPVVMAFEDLEAADSGTLDFIDYLIEWSRSQPIFILALTRPDLLERRPDWGAGHRNVTTLGLEPLSDEAMRYAVAGLVPGLPAKAVKAIVERAEGVPLYAVETVRMLINEGRLAEQDGVYQPVGDLTELQIPNTLHALIAARLDALEREDRAVLQGAAVLGHSFTTTALAGISGAPADELEARLRSLVRREVLELNADPRSPERGQYAFVQGLVREVAYSTLSKRDRRTRHLAAARYYEALGDDELAGVLATHYLDAWKAAPEGAEGEAIGAQARVALRAAAERASVLHSPSQALSYLMQLLAVTIDPAERAAAFEKASAAAELAARFDEQEKYAVEAMTAYRAIENIGGLARAAALAGRSFMGRARIDLGLAVAEPVMAEVEAHTEDPGVVELIATVARMRGLSGDNEVAVQLADQALVAAEKLDLVEIIAGAVMTKGVSLAYLQRNREAMILLPGVLLLAESNGLIVTEARARLNISQFGIIDQPAQSLAIARVGTEKAQKLGLRQWETLLAGNAMMAALHTGDWDWALKTCADVMRDLNIAAENSEVDAYPAVMAGLRGDGGERLARNIGDYSPIAEASSDPQYHSLLFVLRCWLHLVRGELEAAADELALGNKIEATYASADYAIAGHAALWLGDRRRARRVLDLFEALTLRGMWLDASRRALAAGLAALEGKTAEAIAAFAEQARIMRDHGMVLDLAMTLMDEVASVGVAEPAGRAAADEAREILTRLGAKVLIDRLDQLTSTPEPTAAATNARTAATPVETTA